MNRLFGGNPVSVILRLVVLSVIVGIVLSALGITPQNFVYSIELLVRRLYDMGFGAIEWMLGYFLLGALVVVPIWIVVRLFSAAGAGDRRRDE